VTYTPPSQQHSTRPPAFRSPPRSIFQLGIPNCHLRGSQIHIFCFSLLIPLCVFLTSVETNIFHIYEYVCIYIYIYAYILFIYIYIYIYINRKRGERVFLDSTRPAVIFNTSLYISLFLPYAYLFYFIYTTRLNVLPKSYASFTNRMQFKYILLFLTIRVGGINLHLKRGTKLCNFIRDL